MFDVFIQQYSRPFVLSFVFAIVVLVVLGVSSFMTGRAAINRRLADSAARSDHSAVAQSLRGDNTDGAWRKLVERIEQSGLSLADTNDASLVKQLTDAGYMSPLAPRLFTLLRILTTLGLPATFVIVNLASGHGWSPISLYITGALLAVAGLYIPNLWISARASRRRDELIRGFPDMLDLMLVCIEAGLGVEAAFDRVGGEMALSHPLVANLVGAMVLELRAGRSREDALRRMADRASVDQIRSFATLLIQSDKLGSSVAQTLRVYALEMRERRRMAAEEKAHRLPVLISIPLVACMLPVMIGVLMLPAAIRVVRQVLPALGGGH
ncbi:MAG: type II secretion system F family protein [Sphingomonas sp.]|jgi:tight adherence protein C